MNIKKMTGLAAVGAIALGGVAVMASPAMADDLSDVVQAVGMPASGTCDAITDTDLNWGGAASGGWAAGWGEWLNNGNGGAACVRTLTFNNSTQTWDVRA